MNRLISLIGLLILSSIGGLSLFAAAGVTAAGDTVRGVPDQLDIQDIKTEFHNLRQMKPGEERRGQCAWLLNQFAVLLIECGEWYLADPLLEKAADYCPESDPDLRSHIEVSIASCRYLAGHFDEAADTFRKFYCRTASDPAEIDVHIRLAINLGEINQRAGKKREALGYFNRAAGMADSIGDRFLYANAVIHAERLEDNVHVQLATLEKCMDAVYEGDCNTLVAPAYLALARYHYRQADYQAAINEIDRACSMARKLGQLQYETEGLRLWGEIYARQNNPAMSYNCMQRLVDLRQAAGKEMERESAVHAALGAEILEWSVLNIEKGGTSSERWLKILCIVLGVLLVSAAVVMYILRRANRTHPVREGDELAEDKAEETREIQSLRNQLEDVRADLRKLEILYRGFASMTARVRQSLRGIKGDAGEQQTKIKELSSSILQNTLPERRNSTVTEMEKADARFIALLESRAGTSLNPADRNLALYLCHGLTTQEISCITGVLPKSVNQNRYRLRRVLGLPQEADLEQTLKESFRHANSGIDIE